MPETFRTAAGAAAAAALTSRVLARMQEEYEKTEALTPSTVALMYGAYAATLASFASAAGRRSPPLPLPRTPALILGGALGAAGAAVALAGAGRFGPAAQVSGIEPGQLVTAGPYRRTRNPQYLGVVAALAGACLATRSGLAAIITAIGWHAFDRWIPSEERHLERIFGEQYRAYQHETRRWL